MSRNINLTQLVNAAAMIGLKLNEVDKHNRQLMNKNLTERKTHLVNTIINKMDTSTGNQLIQLEAFLLQVMNCELKDIPKYEQAFNNTYPSRPTISLFDILTSETKTPTPAPTPTIKDEEKRVDVVYGDLKKRMEDSKCAICLETYGEKDKITVRHCCHTFHSKCIIPWEQSNRSNGKLCPCCRQ